MRVILFVMQGCRPGVGYSSRRLFKWSSCLAVCQLLAVVRVCASRLGCFSDEALLEAWGVHGLDGMHCFDTPVQSFCELSACFRSLSLGHCALHSGRSSLLLAWQLVA